MAFALDALVSKVTDFLRSGEAVSEPSRAMSMAGIVVYAALGAVAAALVTGAPWVPLGGLALVPWGPRLGLMVAAHLVLVVLFLLLGGRLHRWRLGTRT